MSIQECGCRIDSLSQELFVPSKACPCEDPQHDLICHLIKRLAFPGGSFLIREFKLIYYLKIQITWIQMVADLPPPILRKLPQPTRPERDQDQALPALHG